MNSDNVVNVLDVVGTINIMLSADLSQPSTQSLSTAFFTIEDGFLYIDTPVSIAGLQVFLANTDGTGIFLEQLGFAARAPDAHRLWLVDNVDDEKRHRQPRRTSRPYHP